MRKHRALVIRECQTKTSRAHKVARGETLFKQVGEWFLRTLAELEGKCARIGRKPCLHIDTRMLTDSQIENINRSDWYNEMQELIIDVQRGKQDPAP